MKARNYIYLTVLASLITIVILVYNTVIGENNEHVFPTAENPKFDRNQSIFIEDSNDKKSFAGEIELIEKKPFDTCSYILRVSENLVRLDKNEKNNEQKETLIFDLENNTILALHHERKKFMNIPVKTFLNANDDSVRIIKTNNTKNISGFKCVQWRLKNISQNTEITYWVAGNNFDFYRRFLNLWNKTDKCYQYFLSIPETGGNFPIQQIERTLLRDIKSSVLISKVTFKPVDKSEFAIPEGYTLFSN
jgi:hypothetical protein